MRARCRFYLALVIGIAILILMGTETGLLSNLSRDARRAMGALIEARTLSIREEEPQFAHTVANLAWRIADAMELERSKRVRRSTPPPPRAGR